MSESLNDKLAAFFVAHPREWIDGKVLATCAGGYAWRTRVSDLRKRGMVIENRVRRFRVNGGDYAASEYRYVPASPSTVSSDAHDLNSWDLRS